MSLDLLLAEAAITRLHADFVDAVWRQDGDAIAACCAPDAEWKIAGLHLKGAAEIGSTLARALGGCQKVRFITTPPQLAIDGDSAIGRVHCTEITKLKTGVATMTLGIYFDRYVAAGDRWLFRTRHWALHYSGPPDLSADYVDCPDYGPFPALPGPDEPTFNRRKID
jgi:ketosteroid isomerase-like protein